MKGLLAALLFVAAVDPYRQPREDMVRDQIAARGIQDNAVLAAMRTVPRHAFVPDNLKARAYEDTPLPIGHGQTISQPYIVAYMTELIRLKPGSRVLEIGTGSGYQAAVLGCLTREVHSVEIIPELALQAAQRLAALGYTHIQVRTGDGHDGWAEHGPYDAIVVTAAAEYIPPPLVQQLKDDGRMVIPVGSPFLVQTLVLVEKRDGKVRTTSLLPVRFVPLTGGRGD